MTTATDARQKLISGGKNLLIASIFGCLAWLSITLTRGEGRIAAVWLPNAVALALLLVRTKPSAALILLCFGANVIANLFVGDDFIKACSLGLINSLEISLTCFLMRKVGIAPPNMRRFSQLMVFFAIGGVFAPTVAGLFAALILSGQNGFSFEMWMNWAIPDGLGMMIIAPAIWVAREAIAERQTPSFERGVEWLAVIGAVFGISVVVFTQSSYPLLFLVTPFVLLAAFRLGALGAATSIIIIGALASIATSLETGPIALVQTSLVDRLHILQAFLVANFTMSIPIATSLANLTETSRKLRLSEDLNRSMLDNMREIIFKTDREGRWLFLNPAWETVTGYSVLDSLGWKTTKLLHPDDFAEAAQVYPRLIAGEIQETTLRQRFYRASGELAHIEVSVRRLEDDRGRFAGTVGGIRDISHAVRQEQALKESERRFEHMAKASPVGIFRADASGQITFVNPIWTALTGLSFEESLGDGWRQAITHPEDFAVNPPWTGFEKPGDITRRVARLRGADGDIIWVETVNSAEFNDEGELVGFVGAIIDITEQRRAQLALVEREEQLSLLATNATDAVFRLSLDGECRYASPSAKTLLGVGPDYLVGRNLLVRFHPDDQDRINRTISGLATGTIDSKVIAYRSEVIEAPGTYRWLEANCGLVRDQQTDLPVEIIASIRDITERKKLEHDLLEARQKAENAAAAKSSFLANMSHEIRTPMNGVLGFAELLSNTELTDEQRRYTSMISDSGQAMMRLLNDILDISKIEAGKMQIVDEKVDIRHKMRSVVRLLEPIAAAKGITLLASTDYDVPQFIMGDQLRIRQIMMNLVGNAVKFTDHGHVEICLSKNGQDKREIVIAVKDTGIGIPADQLDGIFDKFSQADGSIARRFGGSGLGLAITTQLVNLMNGQISVQSRQGEGTTFTVRIPLREADDAKEAASTSSSAKTFDPGNLASSDVRILIAEDYEINQELMRAMAKQFSITADIAGDGAQAVSMVEKASKAGAPYDLVLMDVHMPNLDGLDATRRLRAIGFTPDALPIVALTANAYPEDIAACLEAGMQAHISKPISSASLRTTLERFVKRLYCPKAAAIAKIPSALRERYLERRETTFASLRALADEQAIADEQYEEALTLLHQLAGTAGMFGDEKLGITAQQAEHHLRSIPTEARLDAVRSCVEELRKAA